jgi:hypothetical protein
MLYYVPAALIFLTIVVIGIGVAAILVPKR